MLTLVIKTAAIITLTHGLRIIGKTVGPRWSGLILGLPASTAIILFFYAREQGVDFATQSADAALLGLVSAVAFALIVALTQQRRWTCWSSVGAGAAGYLGCAGLMSLVSHDSLLIRVPLVLGALLMAHLWITRRRDKQEVIAPEAPTPETPTLETPAPKASWVKMMALRTFVPAGCLLLVMAVAAPLGPTWAGLIGTFPCTLLAVLIVTSLESGPAATVRTAEAFPLGNFCMVAFIATFRCCAEWCDVAWAMSFGYVAAFVTLAAVEVVRRRASCAAPQESTRLEPEFTRDAKEFTNVLQEAVHRAASTLVPV